MRLARNIIIAFVFAFGASVVTPHHADATEATPRPVYLALGDSLAYGMQVGKLKNAIAANDVSAASFTGYVDAFAADLKGQSPDLEVVDLGCPGETTTSYIAGPCAFATTGKPFGTIPLPLHHPYTGAQSDAAVEFVRTHPGVVRTITIDIGINDVRAVELACATERERDACLASRWPAARELTTTRLRTIFAQLRASAPKAYIYALTYYNWLAIADPATTPLVTDLNGAIADAAARVRAKTVDVYTAFDRTGDEKTQLCDLTLFCGDTHDLHPSDAGYRAIGSLLSEAARH